MTCNLQIVHLQRERERERGRERERESDAWPAGGKIPCKRQTDAGESLLHDGALRKAPGTEASECTQCSGRERGCGCTDNWVAEWSEWSQCAACKGVGREGCPASLTSLPRSTMADITAVPVVF